MAGGHIHCPSEMIALCEESLFEAGDHRHLAQLIDWWLDNPDKIEEWSPKYAAEGMSDHVDKCAARFVGMLQEAIADAKA